MKKNNINLILSVSLLILGLSVTTTAFSIGLRSFVALPIEQGGTVMRFTFDRSLNANIDTLNTSVAYGLTAKQTLLFGLPYRLSPAGNKPQGDISTLYRHIVWQQDNFSGTDRLGLLGGAILPTENARDPALQAGFVFTHFKKRHEIDFDALYQSGMKTRRDSGRYDLSWQYRLSPIDYPDWGITQQINSVVELNGRWREGNRVTQQLTMGLQWVNQKWILEGGMVKDLNNPNDQHYLISTRFHF